MRRLTRPFRTYPAAKILSALLAVGLVSTAAASSVRVKRGDTLSELAQRHHTTVAALQRLNHLKGDVILEGMLLRLPGSAPVARTSAVRTVRRTYTVRPADNLTVLARRWGTTVPALVQRNHLRSKVIVIGQRLSYTQRVRSSPATARVPRGVSASAAAHRAALKHRTVASRTAVRGLIRSAARRHGVPTRLALALAYQESGFQQRVVSPVDAIGVMQVLPSTARSLGRLHGRSYDLLDARDNVEAGVTLLADLLRATGATNAALAGYYQGLGSVRAQGLLPQTHQYIRNIDLLQRRFR
jgi:soluble lytic murein transglycosylase-like protein